MNVAKLIVLILILVVLVFIAKTMLDIKKQHEDSMKQLIESQSNGISLKLQSGQQQPNLQNVQDSLSGFFGGSGFRQGMTGN